MEIDHGGLEPPTAKTKSESPTIMPIALALAESENSRAIMKELLKQATETAQQFAILLENTLALHDNKLPQNHHKNQCIPSSKAACRIAQTSRNPRPQTSSTTTQQKHLSGEQTTTIKTPPLSHEKISLIVGSTAKFPDPKNCIDFSQSRQETLPCWFPKRSGRKHLKTMTQHEILARASTRPQTFNREATATTRFSALSLGATFSAEHYHAFRWPPPTRDKIHEATRATQNQAATTTNFSNLTSGATLREEHYHAFRKPPPIRDKSQEWTRATHKNQATTTIYFKLTRGATIRKEHYQAFRKPPPTRDRIQDWTQNYHE
jgi:hypothetical protein